MTEKEKLTQKFIIVDMNDAQISTDEKTIIGTQALATCIGILLYNEELKKAIVAHATTTPEIAIDKIFKIIVENKLWHVPFKYKIILGSDIKPVMFYNTIDTIKKYFSHFTPFDETQIPKEAIETDERTISHQFAFDASSGKFVTDKVLFGLEYYNINKDQIEKTSINKHR